MRSPVWQMCSLYFNSKGRCPSARYNTNKVVRCWLLTSHCTPIAATMNANTRTSACVLLL